MEQIERLLVVIDTIQKHGTPDDPMAAEWFLACLDDYMRGTDRRTLDRCMNLGGSRGHSAPRTKYMKLIRNQHLKAAYEFIDPDKPSMVRCELLIKEITRFSANTIYTEWQEAGDHLNKVHNYDDTFMKYWRPASK